MASVRQDLISSTKWSSVEKFSQLGIQFLLGIVMARLLTPEDFGTIGMLTIFIAISQTFIDSGFTNALIRKIDRTEDDLCTAFYTNLGISFVCYAILFVIAPWVGDFFHTPLLCPILRIQSVTLIINGLIAVQIAKLTYELNFKALAKRTFAASLLSGIIGIVLAYCGWGVWALVAQNIISSVINLVLLCYFCRWYPTRKFNKASFRNLWGYGSNMLAAGLLNTIYSNLNSLVIGRFFSSRDLGVYTRGTKLSAFPITNINSILTKVTFPILAKIQNDENHLIAVYRKYIATSSMIVFFCCMLMCALAAPIVDILLTSKWNECIIFMQIYCFAIMFDHISQINLNLLQVKGRSDLFLRLEIVKKVISTIILFSAIPFGVIGICCSKIIYSQIAIFINTYYTGKLFGLGYMAQIKDFLPYLILSLVACIPAFLITYINIHPLLMVAIGVVSSMAIYLFFTRKDQNMLETKEMILSKIKKK